MSGLTPPAELDVVVMPAAEAYDFEYFRARVDAELLSRSIAVRVLRMPLLAVPVGGTRRGGWFGADSLTAALAVRDVLAPLNGFPGARITWRCTPRSSYAVEWGDRPPATWLDDNERLAFIEAPRTGLKTRTITYESWRNSTSHLTRITEVRRVVDW